MIGTYANIVTSRRRGFLSSYSFLDEVEHESVAHSL
jgi:hypothetical protein